MKLLARRALTLVVPFLTLAACSGTDSPTTSEPAELASGPLFSAGGGSSPDLGKLARFDSPPSITIAWAKKWIGPEGGRLDFQGFAINVPAGAVDRVTQFSIRLPVNPHDSESVVAEFGPDGTFAAPVAIELPLSGTSATALSDPTIGWWNGNVGQWEDVGGEPTADGQRLVTQTSHFSTYGSMGEGVLVSGG
jgi:hypothetical protein